MEITSRQFGQIEAACFALEEATEKNNTALRLVKVIKDNLAEIAKTAYPLELVFEFDQPELPMVESDLLATAKRSEDGSDPSDLLATAKHSEDGSDKLSEIRLYGQELINQGATMKELIKMVMEHFALTQDAFAHLIKVNQGSLSKYLRNGERKDAVITGVTEFFGDDGGALNDHTRSAETHSPNGARIGSTESGAPEKYPKPRKGGAASNGSDGNFLGNDGGALND